jgi:hypothetical protein
MSINPIIRSRTGHFSSRVPRHVTVVIIKKNTETLIHASKEVGLEVNAKKTKYMSLSPHQNAGQSHYKLIANRSFESVAQIRYFGATVANQNLIQEEIKRRLNSDNACYHSVQNLCLLVWCLKTYKLEYTKL